ncbi:MAG: Zn-dependent hydrolase [Parvularculales bacterium]
MTASATYRDYADPGRIARAIEQLAGFTEPGRPYTRLIFSDEFHAARKWLTESFKNLGLDCHIDAGGNLIGTRPAAAETPSPQVVIIGSHIDTVPAGGRYDGIAGVIAAMEVVHYLNAQSLELPFTLEIADFLGEELNLWGTSCLGSRHMAGLIDAEMLARKDERGRTLGDEIAACGGSGIPPTGPRSDAAGIRACFELHIEQARSLEDAGADIGIVTTLPAIERYAIAVNGTAGHSGTTPMAGRQDALVTAASIIRKVSALAGTIAARSNEYFCATIGKIEVLPNGPTIIPGRVEMMLDVRSTGDEAKAEFLAGLSAALGEAGREGCGIDRTLLATSPGAPMDSGLQAALGKEAKALGLAGMDVASGAGHDSAHLSRFAPVAMVFIPCRGGLSHCPEEEADPDAIAKGAAVITRSVLALAEENGAC